MSSFTSIRGFLESFQQEEPRHERIFWSELSKLINLKIAYKIVFHEKFWTIQTRWWRKFDLTFRWTGPHITTCSVSANVFYKFLKSSLYNFYLASRNCWVKQLKYQNAWIYFKSRFLLWINFPRRSVKHINFPNESKSESKSPMPSICQKLTRISSTEMLLLSSKLGFAKHIVRKCRLVPLFVPAVRCIVKSSALLIFPK